MLPLTYPYSVGDVRAAFAQIRRIGISEDGLCKDRILFTGDRVHDFSIAYIKQTLPLRGSRGSYSTTPTCSPTRRQSDNLCVMKFV